MEQNGLSRLCECNEPGYCPRYQKEMRGRFYEVCKGINVDLGTAAAFREQWDREAGDTATSRPIGSPIPLVLGTSQQAGDAVCMTAAIYSLHRSHPGMYATSVDSPWSEVFEYNPYVSPPMSVANRVQMHYPAIHNSNDRGIHFMQGWTEFLGMALGINIPLLTNRPHLYFANPNPPSVESLWVVCSGGKRDFTNKLWGHYAYQTVVNLLHGVIRFVQVGSDRDEHPRLTGTENMVGKTTLRQLFDLVRRARGVLCGVSLLMHVAAALERPAIVIAGGREPVTWNAYPMQQYVHTVGALPCHDLQGHVGHACWRSRTLPLGDGSHYDNDTCERPLFGLPACMRLISPAEVAALVVRYNQISVVENGGLA